MVADLMFNDHRTHSELRGDRLNALLADSAAQFDAPSKKPRRHLVHYGGTAQICTSRLPPSRVAAPPAVNNRVPSVVKAAPMTHSGAGKRRRIDMSSGVQTTMSPFLPVDTNSEPSGDHQHGNAEAISAQIDFPDIARDLANDLHLIDVRRRDAWMAQLA
jgi:hypothetical protein